MGQEKLMLDLQGLIQREYQLKRKEELMALLKQLKEKMKEIEDTQKRTEEIKTELSKIEKSSQEQEEQVNHLDDQMKSGKERLYHAKGDSLKELMSLQQSVAKMEEDIKKEEAIYWETVSKAENLRLDYKKYKESLKTMKENYNEGVREYKRNKDKVEIELAEVLLKQEDIREKLKPETLKLFEKILKKYPLNPVAIMKKGSCTGCHMSIPSVLEMEVKHGKKLCLCDNCQRILISNF